MDNLLKELTDLLLSDGEFASDGSILKNKLIEAVFASEVSILKILLNSETLKSHFFVEVEGTLIFDKIKFQEFVTNKEFLPDSFTAFENRIGLTAGDSYLSQANEVVLSWPYKDCILEGGMLKTEQKREEIFWNTNLSPENITRLFEPKALIGWEYWDKDAISKGKAMPVERLCLNDNLLIKGNNLLALYSLKTRYAGRIKLIYIDPPYNTGSDTFKYNDRFNHSAWLTFMRNRLEIAKELLSPTGTIFVNLDDNEAHYCKVLMDEIFGRQNFIANIIWQKRYSPDSRIGISDAHEHILCYSLDPGHFGENRNLLELTENQTKQFKNSDNDPRGPWKANDFTAAGYRPNQMYEITLPSGRVVVPPQGRCWRVTKAGFEAFKADNKMYYGPKGDGVPAVKRFLTEMEGMVPWTWWPHNEVGHSQEAKNESQALFDGEYVFDTAKPERLIQRIIHIATNPGEIVLDFFSGSGTTAAVAQKMKRTWIAVEQLDYVVDLPGERLKKVIAGEQGGISKSENWTGGGSFVFAKLAQHNDLFAKRVTTAKDSKELLEIWSEMQATGYLRYDIQLNEFVTEEFLPLPLAEQKQILLDTLDANHLYVNLNSLGDQTLTIDENDLKLTLEFYGITE